MRLSKLKLIGLALLTGLGCGFALAQTTIVQTAISGNEVWRVAQNPGGPEAYIAINTVRGSEPILTASGSGAATSTAVAGTLCWTGTAPTTWTVTFTAAPADGTFIKLCTDTTLTTLVTTAAGSGDTVNAGLSSATMTANATFPSWQYKASSKTWFRIQ